MQEITVAEKPVKPGKPVTKIRKSRHIADNEIC